MKRGVWIVLILIIPVIFLFLLRLINPSEIDDVSSGITCPEIEKYNPNILYIIPNYNTNPISQNEEWCEYILSLNKTLALHGITHEYREFKTDRNQTYLEEGVNEFKACFGYEPEIFKPPQLRISKNNRQLIKENNMKLKAILNFIIHKSYHCSY